MRRIPAPRLGLQARLLLIAAAVLGACLGAAGWVLDRSFHAAVLAGAEEQLRTVAYGLLGAAQERDGGLAFAAELGEPRLSQPDSGLYAYVDATNGAAIWRSPSMAASGDIAGRPPLPRRPAPGESFFGVAAADAATERFVLAYTVIWEAVGSIEMTFWVLADAHPYHRQVAAFRRSIAIGLASAAAIFVGIQFAALRWGLAPLRRMADRVDHLEAGARRDIGQDYPRELVGLARNLNRFIAYEKANRERYRRAMDDLAHSLKTPLAVLKNALREVNGQQAGVFDEQVRRMETAVAHQLSRAVAVRAALPTDSIAVLPVVARIVRALERAYAEKPIEVELTEHAAAGKPDLAVSVDERDLMEMLGNLIENGFKYTRTRVRITATCPGPGRVEIAIEDDGDGIAPDKRQLVLQRGARADTATAGQGIGLAAALELAAAYDGRLHIGDSELGGAALRLELPTAAG